MTSNVETLTVADVEKAIGIPTSRWSGNCYAIACAMLRAKVVKGRPAYGHWIGEVHPKSPFFEKSRVPFQRHGWIVVEEQGPHAERPGLVVDPTRWVFEAVDPYIFVGSRKPLSDDDECVDCGYTEWAHDEESDEATCAEFRREVWPYDEGGDRVRAAIQRPMPEYRTGEKTHYLRLSVKIKARLGLPHKLTDNQIFWLANLPYSVMGRDAWAIVTAIGAVGKEGYVPFDTRTRADAERGL